MTDEKRDLTEKVQEIMEKLRQLLESLTETPQTPIPNTGDRSTVEHELLDIDSQNREEYLKRSEIKRNQKIWRVWDNHLGTVGKDYIGMITLSWECDYCFIYNVRARHNTQLMDPDNIMIDLNIETKLQRPKRRRKLGECVPCEPIGMDVVLHLTLYRRFSKGTGEIQIWPTIAKSFTIEAELLPCEDLKDHTDYEHQVHKKDWDEDKQKVKSENEWGLKLL